VERGWRRGRVRASKGREVASRNEEDKRRRVVVNKAGAELLVRSSYYDK
jgi:hypothetical protein